MGTNIHHIYSGVLVTTNIGSWTPQWKLTETSWSVLLSNDLSFCFRALYFLKIEVVGWRRTRRKHGAQFFALLDKNP